MQKFDWILDDGKFLTDEEVARFKSVLETRKEEARRKGSKVAIKDWMVINLALHTGLRVIEITRLRHGDLTLGKDRASLIVRRGKNDKPRVIRFGPTLTDYLLEFIEWKKLIGEPFCSDAPLFVSSNTGTAMTKRGLQKVFERNAKRAGITGHSIHHLRHTYASHLYRASKYNLRLVQKQLGHSSIKITEVYADVLMPDLDRAVNNLFQ